MGRKFTDDYDAKYRIWAEHPSVCRMPGVAGIPRFGSKKFNSHEELNSWKKQLLEQIADGGGVRWTR